MTKSEAVNHLRQCDHSFLTPEGCLEISKPFGFVPTMQRHYDNRSEFKGLTLSGINPVTKKEFKEGDYAEGLDSSVLATQLVRHLGLPIPDFFGRGSQLRACCDVISSSLK